MLICTIGLLRPIATGATQIKDEIRKLNRVEKIQEPVTRIRRRFIDRHRKEASCSTALINSEKLTKQSLAPIFFLDGLRLLSRPESDRN